MHCAILYTAARREDSTLQGATDIEKPARFQDLFTRQDASTLDNNVTNSCRQNPYQNKCLQRHYNLTIIPEEKSAAFYPSNNSIEPMTVSYRMNLTPEFIVYNPAQFKRLPCTLFYSEEEGTGWWQTLQRQAIFMPTEGIAYLYRNKACRRRDLIDFYIQESLTFGRRYYVSLTSGSRLRKQHGDQSMIYVCITTSDDVKADYLQKILNSFLYCLRHNGEP